MTTVNKQKILKNLPIFLSADLVLEATKDAYENNYHKCVIVSSDGDYAGLVKFLMKKEKLLTILSPANYGKCSILLKRTGAKIAHLDDQQKLLSQKRKSPR